jgi:hypothetical protein
MKRLILPLFAFAVACLLAVPPVNAADNTGKKKKKEAAAAPAEGSATLTGALCVKPKDAGKDIVCGIISKSKGEEKVFLLKADGELGKQIAEMREKGMKAKVSGALNDKTLTVSKVEQSVSKK